MQLNHSQVIELIQAHQAGAKFEWKNPCGTWMRYTIDLSLDEFLSHLQMNEIRISQEETDLNPWFDQNGNIQWVENIDWKNSAAAFLGWKQALNKADLSKEKAITQNELVKDAERYRKLVFTINYLARIPTRLREFIAITAGSNKAGIDEIVDSLQDYRLKGAQHA